MDVQIVYAEKEIGMIPYESIPAFFLILRENGFSFKWDEKNRKIQLRPGLEGKKIFMMKESLNRPNAPERVSEEFIEGINSFLTSCGASVYKDFRQTNERTDLIIILAMHEDPAVDQPKLDVFHDLKAINQKWPFVLQDECREAGINFTSHVDAVQTDPYMKFVMKVPKNSRTKLPETLVERFQVIISMGILARLQANYPLFLLSCLPFHQLSFFHLPGTIGAEANNNAQNVPTVSESALPKQDLITDRDISTAISEKNESKNSEAETFFDYQVIFDPLGKEKILLFGNFLIKNTGSTSLRNPVICLRMTPQGNINFSGQLVPPNIAQTRGVLNSEKGWKYMYDDWFEQAEEKGEIWICPIKYMEILPGQTESFQNFRINLFKDENQQNLKVEGFVFFQEQGLEYKANNAISLSF